VVLLIILQLVPEHGSRTRGVSTQCRLIREHPRRRRLTSRRMRCVTMTCCFRVILVTGPRPRQSVVIARRRCPPSTTGAYLSSRQRRRRRPSWTRLRWLSAARWRTIRGTTSSSSAKSSRL